MNKFRNKHNVNTINEREIDNIIVKEVQRFVMPANSLQEKDINELDLCIDLGVQKIRAIT